MKHGGNVWNSDRPDDWLDFSANLRPEGTPAWVTDVMCGALKDTRYYPDRSMKAARRGLARYLGVEEASVLPTAGGASAIDLSLSARKGRVHIHMPTFGEYAERAIAQRREIAETEMIEAGDTVVLCNPNNPTGTILQPDDVLKMHREIACSRGELIVDEAFADYCPGCSVRHSVSEGLTVIGSLTKILCVPGIRLGYICAAPDQIAVLEKQSVSWCLNTLASAVAAELPGHRQEIEADAALNVLRAKRFAERLRTLGINAHATGVPFLLVDFGRDMTETVARLQEQHILVRTCTSFGLPPSMLRLAVKTDRENDILLEALCDGY